MGDAAGSEAEVERIARRIAALADEHRPRILGPAWWNERTLSWTLSHPSFRTALFRFVDVFPATEGDEDVAEHLHEYLDRTESPRLVDLGLDVSERVPFGDRVAASLARRSIARLGQQFIVGHDVREAMAGLTGLWAAGRASTVDLLGEHTVSEADADAYAARVSALVDALITTSRAWPANPLLERDDLGPIPRASVSIKPTALASCYAPLTRDDGLRQAATRLRPILRTAAAHGVSVWFDMEHYDVKDLTQELFVDLLGDPELASLHAGIVVQAYLKDSFDDLHRLLDWAKARTTPIGIRLVKGAYWDTETVHARAAGWPVPVFERKAQTDANYERCVSLLHDNHGVVRAAFGTHNLRSIAYVIASAHARGIPDDGYEIQLLYGMAQPVHDAVLELGQRLRVYSPVGELVPGMAYLVRRLLENTSNESFVRARFYERRSLDEQLRPPDPGALPGLPPPAAREDTDPDTPGEHRPEPHREWRRAPVRAAFAAAVAHVDETVREAPVPALIGNEPVKTTDTITSVDPGDPERVLARSAACGRAEADRALDAARRAAVEWARVAARDRAAVLFRAAAWFRARRDHLAALEVFEAGKPWAEADADVCEAIDFCEYYGREALRLDRGGVVESPPGEANVLRYQPRGVGVVIAPWNFPLAICTGMVTAALVTGNAVLFKPAEQTPLVAAQLADALVAAGVPPGVFAFLPGRGEDVGAQLVEHPDVAFIAFTGSREVGLGIIQAAAIHRPGQRQVKRVIAEMGGKNPIVIDDDADLDVAVPDVLGSAFGYAGQKCSAASRLVVLDSRRDECVSRLAAALPSLRTGHPRDPNVVVGPIIDAAAFRRVEQYVALAREIGDVHTGAGAPTSGYFVSPTLVCHAGAGSPLVTDEIFGPVLTVQHAATFEDALAVANDTDYALTAGLFSRSPANIARGAAELRAGNVYINRGTTGAIVGRQPFGGYGLSGVGSKAGGPDYLLQFVEPRVVTENTLRQGFAPE